MQATAPSTLAYACFVLAAASSLAVGVVSYLPLSTTTLTGLGFFVAIPLVLASAVALIAGIVLSVVVRSAPLLVLSALSVLLVVEFFGEYGPVWFYNAAPIVYGAAVIGIAALGRASLQRIR